MLVIIQFFVCYMINSVICVMYFYHLKLNFWFHDSFAQYSRCNGSHIPTLVSFPGWTPTLVCCFNKKVGSTGTPLICFHSFECVSFITNFLEGFKVLMW